MRARIGWRLITIATSILWAIGLETAVESNTIIIGTTVENETANMSATGTMIATGITRVTTSTVGDTSATK
jgi:hypothetical protein